MAGTQEHEAAIWKKLHDNREAHIEQARRARDYQAELADMKRAKYTGQMIDLMRSIWNSAKPK